MSSAWLYYNGAAAGMTRQEVEDLPLGQVCDQIACYQIARCGAKEKKKRGGSLFEQMGRL